jgi:lipoate-protein ligase A
MNMAIDEALLSSKLPVLRFYGWKPAGLSIGYFQSVKNFNFENLKRHNIELVRRLTGGNAVLHDKEVTYSFIIDEKEMPKSVVESYREISKGLLKGLENLGLKAVMNKEVEKGGKSAVCFNDPSWYEIIVNGKKIVGSAQKRIDGKLLQHGAVLIDIDTEKYCSLFDNCNKGLIEKVKERMTSINDEIDGKVDYGKVKEAVKKGFEKALNIEFIEDGLSSEEKELVKELERNKYSTDKWNLVR